MNAERWTMDDGRWTLGATGLLDDGNCGLTDTGVMAAGKANHETMTMMGR